MEFLKALHTRYTRYLIDRVESKISAFKLAAMLQTQGFIDEDYHADLEKIKAHLVQNPPSSEG